MIKRKAFTLIELLVVIAIIGILSTIVLVSYNNIRERSRISQAKSDVNSIAAANQMLFSDTKQNVFGLSQGCSFLANFRTTYFEGDPAPELIITSKAGQSKSAGELLGLLDNDLGIYDSTAWHGPYIDQLAEVDPWGREYYFDADYYCKIVNGNTITPGVNDAACAGHDTNMVRAVMSRGPTVGIFNPSDSINTWYGGDNISTLICKP